MVFTTLITAMVLCAKSHDSLSSVSVGRVDVELSTAGLEGGGQTCHKTRETAAWRKDIQQVPRTWRGSRPRRYSHKYLPIDFSFYVARVEQWYGPALQHRKLWVRSPRSVLGGAIADEKNDE